MWTLRSYKKLLKGNIRDSRLDFGWNRFIMGVKMAENIEIKYLETTGMCNYNCPICVERPRNYNMSMDDFYSIVETNFQLFNENGVWLDFSGEPLVDPYFFERVKFMKSKGLKVRISTNGALLDKINREKIIASGIDYIVVSISTLDRQMYRRIRGVDNFELVLSNLMELKKDVVQNQSDMELQAVMIDTCDGFDRKKFIRYFHEKGINVAFHNFTNRSKSVLMDLSNKAEHVFPIKRGLCKGLKSNIGILCNCEVVTCCCDFMARNSEIGTRYSCCGKINAGSGDRSGLLAINKIPQTYSE